MNFTDPTYLRTIHVGLMLGAVHKDNVSSIPIGLVGIYEDALPFSGNANERKKFLDFFLVWALLKTEVSLRFVVSLLEGWTEDEVTNYFARNSKWFNSPVSGKYILYHQRLRTYIIQRIGEEELKFLHKKFLAQLELSIHNRDGSELEQYALKHLSQHYFEHAILNNDGVKLVDFAFSHETWKRQLELCKTYEWSKNGLDAVMKWATLSCSEDVLHCSIERVNLYNLEQDSIPQILGLLEIGDPLTAIQRIEQLSGNESADIQRRFLASLICLIKLVLKNNLNDKSNIDSINYFLQFIEEKFPKDLSVLNWSEFFPSYIVFQIARELNKVNLSVKCILDLTNEFDCDWLSNESKITEDELQILIQCCTISKDHNSLRLLAKFVALQGNFGQSILLTNSINNTKIKDKSIKDTCVIFVESGELDYAINRIVHISIHKIKCETYLDISKRLFEKGKFSEASSILGKVKSIVEAITDHEQKCELLISVSREYYMQGQHKRALYLIKKASDCVHFIDDFSGAKVRAMSQIYSVLVTQNQISYAKEIIDQAILHIKTIQNEFDRKNSIERVAIAFAEQKLFDEAIAFSLQLEEVMRSDALRGVALLLIKYNLIDDAISCISKMGKDWLGKSYAFSCLTKELIQIGQIDKAIELVEEISYDNHKDDALKNLSLAILNKFDLQSTFKYCYRISSTKSRSECWKNLGFESSRIFGYESAIQKSTLINDVWSNQLFLNGIIKSITINEKSQSICKLIFPLSSNDYLNTKLLLEIYYTAITFFGNQSMPTSCNEIIDFDWAFKLKKSLN